MFTQSFDSYVCGGDAITCDVDGFTITARVERDVDYRIDDDDCHNTDQSVTGCDDEQFARLLECRKAWFNDEWFYCGIVLTVSRNGIEIDDHAASLWGIEANYPDSDNSYLRDVANELLSEALDAARVTLADTLEKLTA